MKKRGYKEALRGVESERIEQLIQSYVHSARDREVIRLSLLDDISYTHIADRLELEVSSRMVQEIMNRWMPIILAHL